MILKKAYSGVKALGSKGCKAIAKAPGKFCRGVRKVGSKVFGCIRPSCLPFGHDEHWEQSLVSHPIPLDDSECWNIQTPHPESLLACGDAGGSENGEQGLASHPIEQLHDDCNIQPALNVSAPVPIFTLFIILDGPAPDFLAEVVKGTSCFVSIPSQSPAPRNQVVLYGAHFKPSVFLAATLQAGQAKMTITILGKSVLRAEEIQSLAALYRQHVQAQALKVLPKREPSPSRASLPRTQRFASPTRRPSLIGQAVQSKRAAEPAPRAAKAALAPVESKTALNLSAAQQPRVQAPRAREKLPDTPLTNTLLHFAIHKQAQDGCDIREAFDRVRDEHAAVQVALCSFESIDERKLSQYKAETGKGSELHGNPLSEFRVFKVPGRFKTSTFVVKTCTLCDYNAFKSFCSEVHAYAKLKNRNRYVPLYAAGLDLGAQKGWLVTPKMDSDATVRCCKRKTKLNCTDLRMVIGVCKAVERMHEEGLLHLDLKPQNILLQRMEPYLTDFGSATPISDEPQLFPGGTAMYASPEMARAYKTEEPDYFGTGADSYSLALTVYMLLTGDLPLYNKGREFIDLPTEEQVDLLCSGDVTVSMHKWLPEHLRLVLTGMLSSDPDSRPTPGALRKTLENCLRKEEAILHAMIEEQCGQMLAPKTVSMATAGRARVQAVA